MLKKLILYALSLIVYLVSKLLPVPVPTQCRLYISTLRIPQFDGFVIAAAGKHASVGAPRNSVDIVRVSGQRRLASRRLPDSDGFVVAATGNFLSI